MRASKTTTTKNTLTFTPNRSKYRIVIVRYESKLWINCAIALFGALWHTHEIYPKIISHSFAQLIDTQLVQSHAIVRLQSIRSFLKPLLIQYVFAAAASCMYAFVSPFYVLLFVCNNVCSICFYSHTHSQNQKWTIWKKNFSCIACSALNWQQKMIYSSKHDKRIGKMHFVAGAISSSPPSSW